jgi:hypothetical protein
MRSSKEAGIELKIKNESHRSDLVLTNKNQRYNFMDKQKTNIILKAREKNYEK